MFETYCQQLVQNFAANPMHPGALASKADRHDDLQILNGLCADGFDQLSRLPHFVLYATRHLISETSPGANPTKSYKYCFTDICNYKYL
jgi:hypothetical protein